MTIGKYTSLGNGIQVRASKDGSFTYYHSYRDAKDKKVKRRKLFTTQEANNKAYAKAILMSENVLDTEVEQKKTDEKYTLMYLKRYYFDKKVEKKHAELKKRYSSLKTEEELTSNTNYKNKIYNVKKEEKRFDKAFLEIYLDKAKTLKFVTTDIRELSEETIETIINTQLHTMSEKSVYNLIALVRAIVNYSVKKLKLDCKNPFANLDLEFENIHKNRQRYLDKSEITSLLIECKEDKNKYGKTNPNVFNCVYLAVLSAGRKATILNIRTKDFDFDKKILRLYNLKSEKHYSVFLNDEAISYFKNFLQEFRSDEYVIKDFKSKVRSPQPFRALPKRIYEIMDTMFNKGLNKQDNEERDNIVNFHTLRRSVATNLAMDNVSIYKIMKLLNHTNIKQTQDYLNLSDLNMMTEIESTHSDMYDYNRSTTKTLQSSMSIDEYIQHLKDDNFSSDKDITEFTVQVNNWRFKLENEYDDSFELKDFTTVEALKHYLEYRNEFSSYIEYKEYQ